MLVLNSFQAIAKKIVLEALLEYLKLTGKEYHKPHIFKDFLDDDVYEILSFIAIVESQTSLNLKLI